MSPDGLTSSPFVFEISTSPPFVEGTAPPLVLSASSVSRYLTGVINDVRLEQIGLEMAKVLSALLKLKLDCLLAVRDDRWPVGARLQGPGFRIRA